MKSLIYTVSLPLAALLGFAVHRASLCTVRTIAEIFGSHVRKATVGVNFFYQGIIACQQLP